MSKKSKTVAREPDDFADDFDYEGNASQPYAGQRVAENNLMNNRRRNDARRNDGNGYPMVVLPSSKRYGKSADVDYEDIAEQEDDEMELYRRKQRTYRTVKVFSVIILIFALLGFFVPAYLAIPSSSVLVTGRSVVGAEVGSPFSVFLASLAGFPTALLNKQSLYAWWLLFCVAAILICTIATLATRRACVVWFSFDCLMAVASVFGYLAFATPTQVLVVDFFVLAALIGIVAFFMQAFTIGKSGAVIPMICLIAMIFLLVFTHKDDAVISATAALYSFAGIVIHGNALPATYQFLANITAVLLLVNIVLTILQLCSFRRTTWFSFVRYTVMALLAILSLVLACSALQKTVFGLLYLSVFTLVAILLAILCLIACLHNRKVRMREKAHVAETEEETEEEPAPAPVVAAAPAPAPAYTPVPGSNVYININPQGGTSFATPVPVMQFATDPYTTKKIYSNGFVGTVNRVPHDIDEHTGIRKDEYNPPFDYMGESCANEKVDSQTLLPDRTAPVLSAEELKSVMARSSLDTVVPMPEEEDTDESNITYIAEEGPAHAEEEAVEEIAAEAPAEEVVEEPAEETPAEEVVEEPAEEAPAIEKIEEPVAEEVIDEDEEETPAEPPVEEEEEEEEEGEIEDDAFLQSLSVKNRKEFRATFLTENSFDYLPAYDIGGDNSLFFDSIFIYLSKIRDNISDSLLEAMYNYINS